MRKRAIAIISGLIFIGACAACKPKNINSAENLNQEPTPLIIGGQKDEFGCYVTAGYTWSPTRKVCLRVWEEGIKLDDLSNPTSSLAIFLIQNGENGAMEVYLPDSAQPVVLEKAANVWSSNDQKYRLEKRGNGEISIFHEGKPIAKGTLKN